MKKITSLPLFLVLLMAFLCANSSYAQKEKINKANTDYQSLQYVNAREIYLKVAEAGYESEELLTKVGNTFYYSAKYGEAFKWYSKLFKKYPDQSDPMLYLRYSQSLRSTGHPDEAEKYFNTYQKMVYGDKKHKTAIDYLALIEENSGRYDLKPIEQLYDTTQITFGHTVAPDSSLIYASTSADIPKSFRNVFDPWTGLSFLSLYKVAIDTANNLVGEPERLRGKLKSKFHESSTAITADGKTLYFTRNNYTYGEKDKKHKNLKIYRTKKEDGKWQKPVELPFNGDSFNTAHPALSPSENKLYFASDRLGGYGESDLYVVTIDSTGQFGQPVNLGDTINTAARETFPYISKDSVLYFSSSGHYGLGGLDVFAVNIHKDGSFGKHLINVGKPINSYADDFSYGINSDSRYGFLSSDRDRYNDTVIVRSNIYAFFEREPLKDVFMAKIVGYVTDKKTGDSLQDATVAVYKLKDDKLFGQVSTNADGYYEIEVDRYVQYRVRASKEGYDSEEKVSEEGKKKQRIDFQLERNKIPIGEGVDLAKILNIPKIYFDFDKYNIRPDAQVELEKVYQVLKQYPKLRLKIRSHTDSRGSDAYNQKLSEKRAQSTKAYLVNKGINADRLETEGVGESELVNGCSNGVPCTEEQHQANRRSEFIVIE